MGNLYLIECVVEDHYFAELVQASSPEDAQRQCLSVPAGKKARYIKAEEAKPGILWTQQIPTYTEAEVPQVLVRFAGAQEVGRG